MGSLNTEPLASLVKWIAQERGVRTCIETGTAHGTSAFFAATLFDRVITIDRNAEFQEEARRREAVHRANGLAMCDIEYVLGNSVDVLPDILKDLDSPVFAWLDAHSYIGSPYGNDFCCPLLEEIELFNRFGCVGDWIVIDDVHDLDPPMDPATYPTLMQVLENGTGGCPRSFMVAHDTIVMFPQSREAALEVFRRFR